MDSIGEQMVPSPQVKSWRPSSCSMPAGTLSSPSLCHGGACRRLLSNGGSGDVFGRCRSGWLSLRLFRGCPVTSPASVSDSSWQLWSATAFFLWAFRHARGKDLALTAFLLVLCGKGWPGLGPWRCTCVYYAGCSVDEGLQGSFRTCKQDLGSHWGMEPAALNLRDFVSATIQVQEVVQPKFACSQRRILNWARSG